MRNDEPKTMYSHERLEHERRKTLSERPSSAVRRERRLDAMPTSWIDR